MTPVSIDEIRNDLPDWPSDIVEGWLHPISQRPDLGWPPPEPIGQHPWFYVLNGKPLSWWQQVIWEQKEWPFEFLQLSPADQDMVANMVEGHFEGKKNIYTFVDGKQRIVSALQYIAANRTIPRPLIAMETKAGLRFVDGAHRLTALALASQWQSDGKWPSGWALKSEHSIWVGRHPEQ